MTFSSAKKFACGAQYVAGSPLFAGSSLSNYSSCATPLTTPFSPLLMLSSLSMGQERVLCAVDDLVLFSPLMLFPRLPMNRVRVPFSPLMLVSKFSLPTEVFAVC